MIGSIERLRRCARRSRTLALTPMMLLFVGLPAHSDPIKHGPGKGGVLPIPASIPPGETAAHLDSLLRSHRDSRLERGRVLYAPGHAPRDTAVARPSRKRPAPCPVRRIVAQGATADRPTT